MKKRIKTQMETDEHDTVKKLLIEAIGFKKVAMFHDNGSSRYIGKKTNASIYRLDF